MKFPKLGKVAYFSRAFCCYLQGGVTRNLSNYYCFVSCWNLVTIWIVSGLVTIPRALGSTLILQFIYHIWNQAPSCQYIRQPPTPGSKYIEKWEDEG